MEEPPAWGPRGRDAAGELVATMREADEGAVGEPGGHRSGADGRARGPPATARARPGVVQGCSGAKWVRSPIRA
ncbi:hypothetical protein Aab01nite_46720 [Paractinoplanes abujensis]|nr:hypothetical protein Aab01nite_46720 [Actinoplanes abujensis]